MRQTFISRKAFSLLAPALILGTASMAIADHNLVQNPSFTNSLEPWERPDTANGQWDSPDAGGDSTSGSGRAQDDEPGNGGILTALTQCFQISGGLTYEFGGQIMLPFGQPEGTAGHIGLEAFTSDDCSGNIGVRNNVGSSTTVKWKLVSRTLDTPADARSLEVSVGIEKAQDVADFAKIVADNVYVSEAGNALRPINEYLAGPWFDQNTPGQGLVTDISTQINLFFGGWYTWTTTPDEIDWMTLQGGFRGDLADLTIFRTSGGAFNDPAEVTTDPVGTAQLRFKNCTEAEFIIQFDGEQATTIDLVRLGPAPREC